MLNWQNPGRHERRMQETLNLVFRNHPNLLGYLFDQRRARLRGDPLFLLDNADDFSSAEQVLLRVALDLWCGEGAVRLWDILEFLDDSCYESVIAGLRHLRRNDLGGAEMVWRQPKMARS